MRNLRLLTSILVLLCVALAASALAQEVASLQGAGNPGLARVWFLWTSDSTVGGDTGATPTIYANGTPLGALRGGSAFSHDFSPGTYRFTVDSYGLPTDKAYVAELAPGMQLYLQIQYLPTWQQGIPSGGFTPTDFSFFVIPMPAQLAQAYLPTLNNLGAR